MQWKDSELMEILHASLLEYTVGYKIVAKPPSTLLVFLFVLA